MTIPPPNSRRIERRRIYLGEGLTVRLRVDGVERETMAEAIDLTPEGIGVAVLSGGEELREGVEVAIEHTGSATVGLVHRAVVRNLTTGTFGGRAARRVGLAFLSERPKLHAGERRRARRFTCSDEFPALAAAESPLFFRESLHFRVRQIGAGGMTASTSLRNKGLLPGLVLTFRVNFNMIGVFEVRGRITTVAREDEPGAGFRVGVAFLDPPRPLLDAISEYLLIDDKSLTPAILREGGLSTGSIERAVTYDYARMPEEYDEILALRLKARRSEEGHGDLELADMASPLDKHGRHLVCRFGGKIVIAARVTYVGQDKDKSEYITKGGHEIPDWLWEAGFVEGGSGQTDPDFQRAGLYISFVQHVVRVAMQSGFRYLVLGCNDELLPVFKNIGAVAVDSREVEPRPGWRFRSHVMYLDMHALVSAPPSGKFVDAMASAAAFVLRRASGE